MTDEGQRADAIAAVLGLEPLPLEGGLWTQSWRDEHTSAIYFMLRPGDFSAMHRLRATELWHHYAGAPVHLLLLDPDGQVRRPRLGADVGAGERPFQPVPAGVWMGASTAGAWSLVGTTMSPPFSWDHFELGDRAELAARYPAAADEIERLTRAAGT